MASQSVPRTQRPEYRAWNAARHRCHAPNSQSYADYGGRGIEMAPEWRDDFEAFFAHIGPCPPGLTLERIDNNRGYEPGNVRWETWMAQGSNKRNNHRLTANGRTETISEWSRLMNLPNTTITSRLSKGWDEERAVLEPVGTTITRTHRMVTHNGETRSVAEWSALTGISVTSIHNRLQKGWAVDRVFSQRSRAFRMLTFNGKTQNLKTWAREMGLGPTVLHTRLQKGWDLGKALTAPAYSESPGFVTYNGERKRIHEWAEQFHLSCHALQHRIDRGWDLERAMTTPVAKRKK